MCHQTARAKDVESAVHPKRIGLLNVCSTLVQTTKTAQSQILQVKMIMATNRPDVLDPALLRPGRLDRKIEIPLPNEQARMEILKIHAAGVTKHGDIDYEAIVKLADNFNGADLRNICTEAGMFAIRDERDYTVQVSRKQKHHALSLSYKLIPSYQ